MSSKHIIHTTSITADQMELKPPFAQPYSRIHSNRVPPKSISTTLHWHHLEDEWCYILEAGKNAVLLLREEGLSVTKEIPIKHGDFIGFPAGVQEGHGMKSDDTDIVYLLGGSRENMDTVQVILRLVGELCMIVQVEMVSVEDKVVIDRISTSSIPEQHSSCFSSIMFVGNIEAPLNMTPMNETVEDEPEEMAILGVTTTQPTVGKSRNQEYCRFKFPLVVELYETLKINYFRSLKS
ncbi:hypothetical protein ABKN59_004343 [Abortiporus biennis]